MKYTSLNPIRANSWSRKLRTADEPFEVIRQHIKWGTHGKSGDQPLQFKPLKNLDDDHIQAILDTQKQISSTLKGYLINEQEYRQ